MCHMFAHSDECCAAALQEDPDERSGEAGQSILLCCCSWCLRQLFLQADGMEGQESNTRWWGGPAGGINSKEPLEPVEEPPQVGKTDEANRVRVRGMWRVYVERKLRSSHRKCPGSHAVRVK